MTDCIFKPGQSYKTRDGREARIYAVDGRGINPIHGAVLFDNGWALMAWCADGKIHSDTTYSTDLMPPKRELWVNVFRDESGHIWMEARHGINYADMRATEVSSKRIARIRVEYQEGQFDE